MTTLLSLDQVSVNYGEKVILSNISLSLYAGKIVTLLGPNGAGKSTLAKIILGLIKPTQGQVMVEQQLRIGYVPQSLHLESTFPLSVERFILLKKKAKKIDIPSLLERVKAGHLQHKSMQQLSGGELQRVLLAQAIIDQPQLLVLDEPAQGLDMNGQVLLYNLIEELRQELGCGVLMISHDLFLVMAKTDEVICLNKAICCSGTPQIVAQSSAFTSMFNIQEDQVLALYQHHHCVDEHH